MRAWDFVFYLGNAISPCYDVFYIYFRVLLTCTRVSSFCHPFEKKGKQKKSQHSGSNRGHPDCGVTCYSLMLFQLSYAELA
jgi:hypothetical protein